MIYFSWNVRGLTDPNRKYTIRGELDDITHSYGMPDFVCLQEVKIIDFIFPCTYSFLWLWDPLFHTNHLIGKGGAVTFISSKWKSNMVSWGTDPS